MFSVSALAPADGVGDVVVGEPVAVSAVVEGEDVGAGVPEDPPPVHAVAIAQTIASATYRLKGRPPFVALDVTRRTVVVMAT